MKATEKLIDIAKNLGFERKSAMEFALSQQMTEQKDHEAQCVANKEVPN